MNSKAFEYKIVYGSNDRVGEEVERLTQSGWILHGGHQMVSFNAAVGAPIFSQSLIKEYEQPGAWG
jgi:hypothetical protein